MVRNTNALLRALIAVSLLLTGLIITDNLNDARESSLLQRAATTAEVRRKFEAMKLPLHEGKYWKAINTP